LLLFIQNKPAFGAPQERLSTQDLNPLCHPSVPSISLVQPAPLTRLARQISKTTTTKKLETWNDCRFLSVYLCVVCMALTLLVLRVCVSVFNIIRSNTLHRP
jgi:hypothetical protein